jgi:hypothetical protein
MSYTAELVANLDLRLAELNAEIARLEDARTALSAPSQSRPTAEPAGRASSRRRAAAAPNPVASAKAGASRSSASTETTATNTTPPRARRAPSAKPTRRRRARLSLGRDELESLLAGADGGLSASAIAEQTRTAYDPVLKMLRELEASGQVRRDGSRRSTLWRLITDDERIAERAAELERRSARGT